MEAKKKNVQLMLCPVCAGQKATHGQPCPVCKAHGVVREPVARK